MYMIRLLLAGFFMGMANLVPGVSGGTMILALGFYQQFIDAFSRITRLRFQRQDLLFLSTIFGFSFLTILIFSGLIQILMESFRPQMLGVFIGLTLGGVPTLYAEVKGESKDFLFWGGLIAGIAVMVLVAFVFEPSMLMLSPIIYFLGGIIGSSAMVLPGISGSYLLLILGLYLPLIGAIYDFKNALIAKDITALMGVSGEIIIPFALGMAVGILVLSNFLHYLLRSHKKITQTFLLGLLVGSVFGLYPFKTQPLEKLTKYQVTENSQKILHVKLFGDITNEDVVYKKIEALKSFGPTISIEKFDRQLLESDLDSARKTKELIVLYAHSPEDKLRKIAKDKKIGVVPLVVISDTSYSLSKLIIILLLILIGAGITYMIGKIKQKESK